MKHEQHGHYKHLGVMIALSFASMYILMYAMVYSIGDIFMNVNQFYMAGLMTAPMVAIELFVMRAMYQDARLNGIIVAVALIAGVAMFAGIRTQAAVGDSQFLRSMIPHHSGAILMCERAPITSPDIKQLCQGIISSQRQEIDQMVELLRR